jgi:16S rRNA C967 or C1407 C5-methylase (RsmB/RsmF family)/NOL1/NOP2/fmu family ribosome biogenesis protein
MTERTSNILPEAFRERIRQQFQAEADQFFEALNCPAATSIRINPHKFKKPTAGLETIPWSTHGFFLNERPIFTLDPLLHAGAYYVQEASSMFLEQAFRLTRTGEQAIVLDLCGAPGGKSTHLLSLLSDKDLLVSNEVIRSRAVILDENIRKWGHSNVVITSNDPRDFGNLASLFDVIVVDAPCSGEGLFRRDVNAMNQWSVENTNLCATRQRRILADVWPALKPGGYLIYSTCTFNPGENEENLQWLSETFDVESIRIPLAPEWPVSEYEKDGLFAYRFLPHRVKGEGFFLTIVHKAVEKAPYSFPKKFKKRLERLPKQADQLKQWVAPDLFDFFLAGELAVAFPSPHEQLLGELYDNLNLISFGLPLAQIKKNDFIPEHALALACDLNSNPFPTVELSLEQALAFLKKEEIRIARTEKGWILVCYQGQPLGFVKNLGTRANNYYPKEWRIRMNLGEEINLPWHQML